MFFKKGTSTLLVCFYQQEMIVCLIAKETINTSKPFKLVDYHRTKLNQLVTPLGLTQPEEIVCILKSFACKNKLNSYALAICLDPQWVKDQFVVHAHEKVFHEGPESRHIQEQSAYVGQYAGNHLYYHCTVTSPLLFQLQLIGIRLKKEIITITSMQWCLLLLIKHIHGPTFRAEHIAQRVKNKQLVLKPYAITELTHRLLFNQQLIDIRNEMVFLLACVGLTRTKDHYE